MFVQKTNLPGYEICGRIRHRPTDQGAHTTGRDSVRRTQLGQRTDARRKLRPNKHIYDHRILLYIPICDCELTKLPRNISFYGHYKHVYLYGTYRDCHQSRLQLPLTSASATATLSKYRKFQNDNCFKSHRSKTLTIVNEKCF